MLTDDSSGAERAVAAVQDADAARELLREPTPALLWAISRRIDELRFQDPPVAFEVAEVALDMLERLPVEQRERALRFALWAAYGSTCRATARFRATERALLTAARIVHGHDPLRTAEVAERLAYLRADQGREAEARNLVAFFLEQARSGGDVNLGRRLTAAASVLNRFRDYGALAELGSEALALLPPNGDRFHLSALYYLAQASLGAASRPALLSALDVVYHNLEKVPRGSFPWLRLQWLAGNLLRCSPLERYEEALQVLGVTHAGFEQKGDAFDRALLIVDLAELHLDRGVPEDARDLARQSFRVLGELRNWPEACRALHSFYRAATELKLERSLLDSIRQRLLSARR